MFRIHHAAVLAAFVLGTTGCSSDEPAADEATSVPVATTDAAPQAAPLSDPQIAHVAVTANTIDIETAKLVEPRTENTEVRAFAETMIRDHTAVNEKAAALAQRLGVTPEENDVSRSLDADAASARSQLESLQGDAFDRAYIDREVAYHQAVLDALDQTLIPSSSNQELRALLQEVRPAIAAHLEHARSLQASLGAGQ